ncbi:hypothetical protein [Pseudooceanicola nanhaiensis]|uniref:hypothetical protein n=1 Tax=Pseudooceanicola nanhaiensis TaxID=375761 RepID=UPI001CD6DE5A|nr:hypothetical protein [Pseudooceanicola nanhaiensis]MCA0921476.1 hypothetical protein [Pseudooceanicola nanhaiensis]
MNNEKSQLDKFKEAARQLETDDDEERFDERLKKIVKRPLTEESGSDSMPNDDGADG